MTDSFLEELIMHQAFATIQIRLQRDYLDILTRDSLITEERPLTKEEIDERQKVITSMEDLHSLYTMVTGKELAKV